MKRAVVIGAGIAGLAAGQALISAGYEVRVLERDRELRAEGNGLTLWPNAIRALRELRMDRALRGCGTVIREAVTRSPDGRVLARIPIEQLERRFGPLMSVHRGDFLTSLAAPFGSQIELGRSVRVQDGVLWAGDERLQADLIVGADGIGSVVRELIAPGVMPRAAGYGAWRGVASGWQELSPAAACESTGRDRRFGFVGLTGGRTYWFAVLGGHDAEDTDLAKEFAGWHEPIAAALETTPQAARSYLPILDLPKLPRWHRGNLVLVGDAAHAMTPNLGQGAAQALEDVATLGAALTAHDRPEDAFAAYVGARKRRAERVVAQSRAMGRLLQGSNPVLASTRDVLARITPDAVFVHRFGSIFGS